MNQNYKVTVEVEILEIRDVSLKIKNADDKGCFIAKSLISNILDDEDYEDAIFHKDCVELEIPLWLAEKEELV